MSRKSGRYLLPAALAALAALLVLAACGSSPTPTPAGFSFKRDVQPTFNESCVVCHQGGTPPAGLSLESGKAYSNLVNVGSTESSLKRVAPGAPGDSYIILKLEGNHAGIGRGGRMPLNQPPLSPALIDAIRKWISAGAPDN